MKDEVLKAIARTRVIAIIRGMEPTVCVNLARAFQAGGLRLVEVTFDQAGDPEQTVAAIRAIRAECPEMQVGAGTVITPRQLELTIEAGGGFFVSPNTDAEIIRAAARAGLVSVPGAFTPTEIVQAHRAGADFVKVFPVRSLGAAYIKDVLAPLRHIPLLAVGGVTPENAADYIKAGCRGVGVSGALVNREAIAAGAWDRITAVARNLIESVSVG